MNGFILIPDEVAERTDLSGNHKLILASIGRIQGRSASCYPSVEYLAKSVGISKRQARRCLTELIARKEVVRLFHKNQTSTYSAVWATARNLRRKWAEQRAMEES